MRILPEPDNHLSKACLKTVSSIFPEHDSLIQIMLLRFQARSKEEAKAM
jgi:hypothetical protein